MLTGSGATLLIDRKTTHLVLQSSSKNTSVKGLAETRKTFSGDIALISVDEMSMLLAEFLVLLDERMRKLYDFDQIFGGMSVLLSGDFLQIKRAFGRDLWDAVYSPFKDDQKSAKIVFSQCI